MAIFHVDSGGPNSGSYMFTQMFYLLSHLSSPASENSNRENTNKEDASNVGNDNEDVISLQTLNTFRTYINEYAGLHCFNFESVVIIFTS